ncbi:glycosyltransferase [Hyalangium versicolor]|uniref:glycosyltransferase n=1 Tax=Hyalangium versicolor TaxID=2861190 RepID=UPI001CCF167E|nr:glycosyltransferase [Hyalangium versicolor]
MRRQLQNSLENLQRVSDVVRELGWQAQAQARRNVLALRTRGTGRWGAVSVAWPRTYDWEHAAKWADPFKWGLAERARLEEVDLPQNHERVVLFEVGYAGARLRVALDYADSPELNSECLREVALYFKMQYRQAGYGSRRVLPAGYVPGSLHLYDYLAPTRALRDERRFTYDVLGRFELDSASDLRRQALEQLEAQTRFRFHGGARGVRYSRLLREVALSRVCVDMPGNGGFGFQLMDFLAVGSCVVAPRHVQLLPGGLVEGEHVVFVRPDLSDLVDTCARYVEDTEASERIARNARHFFDAYLHRRALADACLSTCVQALEAHPSASPFD